MQIDDKLIEKFENAKEGQMRVGEINGIRSFTSGTRLYIIRSVHTSSVATTITTLTLISLIVSLFINYYPLLSKNLQSHPRVSLLRTIKFHLLFLNQVAASDRIFSISTF